MVNIGDSFYCLIYFYSKGGTRRFQEVIFPNSYYLNLSITTTPPICRHKADSVTNGMRTRRIILSPTVESSLPIVPSMVIDTQWIDVQVGDILEVRNNEQIPADLIVLASSEAHDVAYIETANIDGESNLKVKVAASTGIRPQMGESDHNRRSSVLQK